MEMLWYLCSIFHVSSEKEANVDELLLQTGQSDRDPVFMRQFHSNRDDRCVMQTQLVGPVEVPVTGSMEATGGCSWVGCTAQFMCQGQLNAVFLV